MADHQRELAADLDTHLTKIAVPYRCRKSALSYGLWDASSNMIEIIHQHRSVAKCFLSMGTCKNSTLYLYPEEAIFLMQSSLLHVSISNFDQKPNLPLSLSEAYSLWFNQSMCSLNLLHVYQYLTRIGFILTRHQPQAVQNEKHESVLSVTTATISSKRKRDEYEGESIETPNNPMDNGSMLCPIHSSSDCQRQWFPRYTDDPPISIKLYPRLTFPEKLSPIHIDWLPVDYNVKVANVQLSLYQNNTWTPRPSYSLLRSADLQSHTTVYRRLSSLAPRSCTPTQVTSSSNIVFDMSAARKPSRKTHASTPDYHIEIKDGDVPFNFHELYTAQQGTRVLTAIVHNGDISFYSFKPFDPVAALQST